MKVIGKSQDGYLIAATEFDDLVKALRSTADKIDDHRPLFDKIVDGA